jgi:predicted DNA-binding ArsR family transcriptional regulator
MKYSQIEHEAISLCIAFEALNDIVNHALMDFTEVSEYPREYETRFKTSVHQQLFLVRLLDFVHEHGGESLTQI